MTVTHAAIAAVWHIEAPKLLGALTRLVRDIGRAEDLAQEAFLSALEVWQKNGIPENPGAWLMTAAKNRAIDQLRRDALLEKKHEALSFEIEASSQPQGNDDDLLNLILISCHPVLSKEARVALTLRLLGGLTTDEIARAFLLPEATIAQRIVRAKRTLSFARVPFDVPEGLPLKERLPAVFEVLYLIFNEGYAASSGDDWMRPQLCQDAMRLGRVLAGLVPAEAEAHGLVALMELQASRMRARLDSQGNPILLMNQNRAQWDFALIQHGFSALARAESLQQPLGVYTLQAAIAACHARALTPEQTDWARIVALYDALVELTQSPVVELNRAVAVSMAYGPTLALELVDALVESNALDQYHYLPIVRGDLLEKLGRKKEATREFERALPMLQNARERDTLRQRIEKLSSQPLRQTPS